jgi:16S rRNA processing protein RimM
MTPGLDLESADLPADAVEVGRIAEAWGIKGWFKVLPHSADPQALFYYKRW